MCHSLENTEALVHGPSKNQNFKSIMSCRVYLRSTFHGTSCISLLKTFTSENKIVMQSDFWDLISVENWIRNALLENDDDDDVSATTL